LVAKRLVDAQTKHTHVTAHIRKAARTRADIQKRLRAIPSSNHSHPTKWYGPSQTTCIITTDTDRACKGTRSNRSQEAKEEVVQGQGYARLLHPIHAHTIHILENSRNHESLITMIRRISKRRAFHPQTSNPHIPKTAPWSRTQEQFR
jgi:hypothetical protein